MVRAASHASSPADQADRRASLEPKALVRGHGGAGRPRGWPARPTPVDTARAPGAWAGALRRRSAAARA